MSARRFLACLFAAVIALGLLGGCSGQPDAPVPGTSTDGSTTVNVSDSTTIPDETTPDATTDESDPSSTTETGSGDETPSTTESDSASQTGSSTQNGSTTQNGSATQTGSGTKNGSTTNRSTTPATTVSMTMPGEVKPTQVDQSKVDLSGRVTDLKGRVIKFQILTQTSTNASDANWQKALEGFKMVEEKYNCKIQVVKCDLESNGDSRVLTSMLAGDPIADILVQDAQTFYSRYGAGLLENLSALKVFDFDSENSPHPPWGIAAKVNGDYYSYTNDDGGAEMAFSPVVVYNKKLLEEYVPQYANVPWNLYKSGDWTWDKFYDICDAFNRAVKSSPDMTALYDGAGTVYKTMLVTAGTDWLTYNKIGDIIFNARDSKAQDILNKYKSYVQKGTIMLGSNINGGLNNDFNALSGSSEGYGFKSGKAAFAIATFNNAYYWDGMMSYSTQQSVKDNLGVLPLPKWNASDDYQTIYPLMVRGTSIPSGLNKPNEVATILNAIFNETDGHYLNGYVVGEKSYIDQWYAATLTAKMGSQNREVMELLYNDYHTHKITPYVGDLGSLTSPDVMYGFDDNGVATGWYSKYVYEIAKGNIAQSAALDAVEDRFTKSLKRLTTIR